MRKRHAKEKTWRSELAFIVCLLVVIGGSGYLIKRSFH